MIETVRGHIQSSVEVLQQVADSLSEQAAEAAEMILEVLRAGRRVYVCGNGGSAAEAQHIAAELVGRFMFDRPALPCIALTTDTSILTAVANDYENDYVFQRQVEALVRAGDLLWVLSTSGQSPNVVRAAAEARRQGARILAMTGRTGGKLKPLCDLVLCVPADSSALIQEAHLALVHALCSIVEQSMFAPPGEEGPR